MLNFSETDMTIATLEANGRSLVCENSIGNRLCMRMIFEGGGYGVASQKIHTTTEPMVEFYDTKAMHYNTTYGQILGCYRATELIDMLNRHPGQDVEMPSIKPVTFWNLRRYEKKQVLQWLKTHYNDHSNRLGALKTHGPEEDVKSMDRIIHASMMLQSELQHLAGSRNGFLADVAIESVEVMEKLHRRFERTQANLAIPVIAPVPLVDLTESEPNP